MPVPIRKDELVAAAPSTVFETARIKDGAGRLVGGPPEGPGKLDTAPATY